MKVWCRFAMNSRCIKSRDAKTVTFRQNEEIFSFRRSMLFQARSDLDLSLEKVETIRTKYSKSRVAQSTLQDVEKPTLIGIVHGCFEIARFMNKLQRRQYGAALQWHMSEWSRGFTVSAMYHACAKLAPGSRWFTCGNTSYLITCRTAGSAECGDWAQIVSRCACTQPKNASRLIMYSATKSDTDSAECCVDVWASTRWLTSRNTSHWITCSCVQKKNTVISTFFPMFLRSSSLPLRPLTFWPFDPLALPHFCEFLSTKLLTAWTRVCYLSYAQEQSHNWHQQTHEVF